MIKNQWYVVLESKEVRKKPLGVTRLGEKLVFWRDDTGKVICFPDKCIHRGVQLSKGKIINNHLQCPFHGLEFELNGKCSCIPANGKNSQVSVNFNIMPYKTFEKYNFIWIFWGNREPENEPLFFLNIDDEFSQITAQDPWNTHYSRVIENQLDVAHLPFVHRKTIGRGNRTLVDGPLLKWINDSMFYLCVFNKEDTGQLPKKPSEIKELNEDGFRIEFIFPNLWQNRLSEKMRIVAAFVPVDEESTLMYLRFCQKFIKVPGISWLFNHLFMPFNLKIAHEDRRIVTTHQPKRSDFISNENLFQADSPIIQYRKKRQDLKDITK